MRKPLVMGNWKLNGTKESVNNLVNALIAPANNATGVEVAVCAPAIFIGTVEALAKGSALQYGSEDCDVHTSGAFTGENSPVMIKEFGCKYAIVGHSERRQYHNETDEVVAAKYEAAQAAGLIPVLCIGESLAQFEAGQTADVVKTQIKAVVDNVSVSNEDNENKTTDLLKRRMASKSSNTGVSFNVGTQTIIDTLMKDGYRYNIHVIMAVKGDISEFRSFRNTTAVKNVFMFNAFDGRPVLGDAYFIREMLKNISIIISNSYLHKKIPFQR